MGKSGLLSWFFAPGGRKDATNLDGSLALFREIYGHGRVSASGQTITVQRALEVATVLACCRVIAEGIAQVPFRLYQATAAGRDLAKDHPLYRVLYRRPNGWQSSFEFRETLIFHLLLTGNAFVFVNRVGLARVVKELVLIEPGRVSVKQLSDLSLQYTVTAQQGGGQKMFGADSIWHLRGPSWNSWMGMEATKLARNAIGLSVALEEAQAGFYKNGARTTGVLSVEDKLNQQQYKDLRDWLMKYAVGAERQDEPLLLDRGAKYTPFTMSGVDNQHLETRKHQIEDICRAFRVFPQMVGHAGDQTPTFASAEQFFLAHVIHTLMPWYERIEHSADINLLSDADIEAGYYTKFTPNALMRGAAADRADFYAKALGSGNVKGWMSQNEVRDAEDMNRVDVAEADQLPQPPVKPLNPSEKLAP